MWVVDFGLTGLSRGGQQVQKCRDTYVKAVGTLVELASLQVGPMSPPPPYHYYFHPVVSWTCLD